jgi:hypothetical protein
MKRKRLNDAEKDAVVEAARVLMLEAMTMAETVGTVPTVAALLSCASSLAAEGGMAARDFAELALATVEATFPDAVDAAEDWRP